MATSRPSQWVIRRWSTTPRRVRTVLVVGAAIVIIAALVYEVRSMQRGYYRSSFDHAKIVSISDSDVCAQGRGSVHCVGRGDVEGTPPPSPAVGDCLTFQTSMVDDDEIRKVTWEQREYAHLCS